MFFIPVTYFQYCEQKHRDCGIPSVFVIVFAAVTLSKMQAIVSLVTQL